MFSALFRDGEIKKLTESVDATRKRERNRELRTAHPYLKGQDGEWLPRQPQWQHWGELWLMHELDVEEEAVELMIDDWATATAEKEELVEVHMVVGREYRAGEEL